MTQNDDHIEPEAEDSSETLDSTKPMDEIGGSIGCYKLLSVVAAEGAATANGIEASQMLYVNTQGEQVP